MKKYLNQFLGSRNPLFVRHKTTNVGVHPAILKKLDEGYARLSKSKSNSLLKKHLTPAIFKSLRTKRTKDSTLLDCIQSGLKWHDSDIGIYAPDPEAYKVFGELYDPIIKNHHFFEKQPYKCYGNPCNFGDLDPFRHYIASTRIRCARNVIGYPFTPCMTKQNLDDLEDIIICTLSGLKDDLKGTYYPLLGMHKSEKRNLIKDHTMFREDDRFLQAAKSYRCWPTGRGIYYNLDKTFIVWVNKEDHIRVISMQRGGNFAAVFSRLVRGINAIEQKIQCVRDEKLGYLTFCPSNLGTTIRASVHIRVPKLASNEKKLKQIIGKYRLQARGTYGLYSQVERGVYDISNRRRLGLTEYQAVSDLYTGIAQIIKLEKEEVPKPLILALKKTGPKIKKDKPKGAAPTSAAKGAAPTTAAKGAAPTTAAKKAAQTVPAQKAAPTTAAKSDKKTQTKNDTKPKKSPKQPDNKGKSK